MQKRYKRVSSHKRYTLIKFLIVIVVLSVIAGCAKMAYDTLNSVSKNQCYDIPSFDERRECLERHDKVEYEEYRRIYEKSN